MSSSSLIYGVAGDLWRDMKLDYERALFERFEAAEQATNGYLLNKAGRAEHINPFDLFTGAESTAYRYASRELVDYWGQHGRLTLRAFEAQWLNARGEEDAYDARWAADRPRPLEIQEASA